MQLLQVNKIENVFTLIMFPGNIFASPVQVIELSCFAEIKIDYILLFCTVLFLYLLKIASSTVLIFFTSD